MPESCALSFNWQGRELMSRELWGPVADPTAACETPRTLRAGSLASPFVSDQDGSTGNCVFCGIVAGRIPCAKVAEDASTLAFMDIDPGSDGHLLVIPKRHSADLVTISEGDLAATTLAAQRISKVAISELGADGVNLLNCSGAAAWQTVFHFHLHVIPRYRDKGKDRLELPFEPGQPTDPETIADRARLLAAALL